MNAERWYKPAFSVIGKEGSSLEGEGFVSRLWEQANLHFDEIAHLACRNDDGSFCGFWGAMTDFSRSFLPWTDGFSCGLYLAGAECEWNAAAPAGWTRWEIPAFEYVCILCEKDVCFEDGLQYLAQNGLQLAGAVQEWTCPSNGQTYMCYPIQREKPRFAK